MENMPDSPVDADPGSVCEQDINESLALVKELIGTVKKNMQTRALETAINLIRQFLDEEKDDVEMREIAHYHLMRALMTRFGCYGWVEDRDECITLTREINTIMSRISSNQMMVKDSDQGKDSVRLAFELIRECRDSVDGNTLNTAICVAEETLPSCSGSSCAKTELLVLLGNALVLSYLLQNDAKDLRRASSQFQEADSGCQTLDPWKFVSLLSLEHVACLEFVECGELEALGRMNIYHTRAADEDERAMVLSDLAESLVTQEVPRVEAAVGFNTMSLSLRMAPHPMRPSSLWSLATDLFALFEQTGDLELLEECISHFRESLSFRPVSHPRRPRTLHNFANSLLTRFEEKGDCHDLEECIPLYRESLALEARNPLAGAVARTHLADALLARYKQSGNLRDLEESISLNKDSLASVLPPHYRHSCLTNFAKSLLSRFIRAGDPEDLEQCILSFRESLILTPIKSSLHPRAIANLANLLLLRFRQKGDLLDLEECIAFQREALALIPAKHPYRFLPLVGLTSGLLVRYERKGDIQDLEESIASGRESMCLRPLSHPRHSTSLSNLANSLLARFELKGNFRDLEECIAFIKESLSLAPSSHPNSNDSGRSSDLDDLGRAMLARFKQKGDIQDLEESISFHKESLALRLAPHPRRCASLDNLAKALMIRYDSQGNHEDIETTLCLLKEASLYETGSLMDRMVCSQRWATIAQMHRPSVALEAYRCALSILPLLASLDLTLEQRKNVLARTRDLIGNAARCAIEQNQLEAAVTFLATSRSTFWSQALELRAPVNQLAAMNPALAQSFRTISAQLESASFSPRDSIPNIISSIDSKLPNQTESVNLHLLAQQRNQALEEIRKINGFEDFLLPPTFNFLQKCAHHGPVVMLSANRSGSDALIVHAIGPVQHIPLPGIDQTHLAFLGGALQELVQGRPVGFTFTINGRSPDDFKAHTYGGGSQMPVARLEEKCQLPNRPTNVDVEPECDIEISLRRGLVRKSPRSAASAEKDYQTILHMLWLSIVEPVIRALRLTKTNSPQRIWWCPTGLFAFLPIHAAGIYSADGSGVCLADYVISSYCSFPQDLLSPSDSPPKTSGFKMLAVIEPEATGGSLLPKTLDELERIRACIPHPENLLAHVGSCKSPTRIDDVLADIGRSTFVHFGCHGVQNPENPLESSLLLSGGKLTVLRIIAECQALGTPLAYLSACETAKGDEEHPDESLNLVATMTFAGFRSVVGTMWSIRDNDAPLVAEIFYGYLFRHGATVPPKVTDSAYALHIAVKELRKQGKPFRDWVPFVHFGI